MKVFLKFLGIHPSEQGGSEVIYAVDSPIGDFTLAVAVGPRRRGDLDAADEMARKKIAELARALIKASAA